MKTITETMLESELQEFYLISKSWISKIAFFEGELGFLKKLFEKFLVPLFADIQSEKIQETDKNLKELEKSIKSINTRAVNHLKHQEPILTDPEHAIRMDLIIEHTHIENELNTLLLSLTEFKNKLFPLIKKEIRPEKLNHLIN